MMKNISLTKLGLGGATFGNLLANGIFGGVSKESTVEIINYAFESGIKIFDTAPLYGFGRSELWYGRALKGIPREQYNITSKCGRLIRNPNNKKNIQITESEIDRGEGNAIFDYSPEGIRRSVDETLNRLNTDYLDTLLLHDPDQGDKEEEAVKYAFPEMLKLKEEGVVKKIGCGMNQIEMPLRFMQKINLDKILLAGRYTLLENLESTKFMDICTRRNVQVIIGGPFNSGVLARNLDSPVSYDYEIASQETISRAKLIEKIANSYNVSLKSAALNFVLMHQQVFSVVPGMSSIDEVNDNVNISQDSIPKELWKELSEKGFIS